MPERVLIALPWYKYTNPLTAFSVMGLLDRRKHGLMMNFGDAFIIHSRNKLATRFLESKFDWILMIDDDMIVPFGNGEWFRAYTKLSIPDPFASFHTVDRLLSHHKTLVGALYYSRNDAGRPIYADSAKDKEWLATGPHNQIKPVRWVGTGCILIHRTVFEDIEKRFPFLGRSSGPTGQWFTPCEHDFISGYNDCVAIFQDKTLSPEQKLFKLSDRLMRARHITQLNSGLGMGEDVQFCIRASQCGHVPYVDLGLICGHVGNKVYGPSFSPQKSLKHPTKNKV